MEVTINRQTNKYQSARTCMVDEAGGVSNRSAGASPLSFGAQDSGQNLWETKPTEPCPRNTYQPVSRHKNEFEIALYM